MRKKLFFILLTVIFLASCDKADSHNKQKDTVSYLPISRDSDGCMRYRVYADNRMSVQAILYKNKSGEFTPNKDIYKCD
jgi:hypothetical protein